MGDVCRQGCGWFTGWMPHSGGWQDRIVDTEVCLLPQLSTLSFSTGARQAVYPNALPILTVCLALSKPGLASRCLGGPGAAHHSGHLDMYGVLGGDGWEQEDWTSSEGVNGLFDPAPRAGA